MSARRNLLESVQGLLERTYDMGGLRDVGRFLIGDAGFRRFYGDGNDLRRKVGSASDGARLLLRECGDGLRAAVYYPDALVERLEARPPQHGLCDENVDAFAALVEELDHLLLVAERARQRRPVTLFELELHANVSKQLVLERFLVGGIGGGRRLGRSRRVWLRHHLFGKVRYCDDDPQVRDRYRDAARWAVKLLDALPRRAPHRRLRALRRFHRMDAAGKVRLIDALAAPTGRP